MDITELLTNASTGSGLARLARTSLHLIRDAEGDDLKLAVRVVLEQLFRKDAPNRRRTLAFAAVELGRVRDRRVLSTGDAMFVDLVRAACVARTGDVEEARLIVDACREQLRPLLVARWEEVLSLGASADPRQQVRANALREEAAQMEEAFEAIASDVCLRDVLATVPARSPEVARPKSLILVVDDDDDVRDTVGSFLSDNGYDVVTAENGMSAIALIEDGVRPGAILLDLMMPVMNGWDFYRWQQSSLLASTPTIVFTATGLRQGAMGSVHVLSKSGEPSALLSALSAVTR